jgi:hypothetical protein
VHSARCAGFPQRRPRPKTMPFACLGTDGAPAKQTTRVTVTVERNECGRQSATIGSPAVAQPIRSGSSLSAKVLLGNLISGS